MRSSHRYASIDPLSTIGPALDRLKPMDTCCCLCCRCSRRVGLFWALGLFVFEAVVHITISLIRPTWQWRSTMLTFIAFYLQDSLRAVLLVLCFHGCKALNKGRDGVAALRLLLRGLCFLAVLEMFEISLKAVGGEHTICEGDTSDSSAKVWASSPAVWAARARGVNGTGLSEAQCELLSDLYDYLWGAITLLVLALVIRVVHSHIRALGGATWAARPSPLTSQRIRCRPQSLPLSRRSALSPPPSRSRCASVPLSALTSVSTALRRTTKLSSW